VRDKMRDPILNEILQSAVDGLLNSIAEIEKKQFTPYKSVKKLVGLHITATEKRNFLFALNQNNPEYFDRKIKVNTMVFKIIHLGGNLYELIKYETKYSVLLGGYETAEYKYKLEVK
jgi:hypothetical protein